MNQPTLSTIDESITERAVSPDSIPSYPPQNDSSDSALERDFERARGTLIDRLARTLDQLSQEQRELLQVISKSRPRISRPTWILLGIAATMSMGLGIARLQSQTPLAQSLLVHVSSLLMSLLAGISYLFDRSTSLHGRSRSNSLSLQERWQEIQVRTSNVASVVDEIDVNVRDSQQALAALREEQRDSEHSLQLLRGRIDASKNEATAIEEQIAVLISRKTEDENSEKQRSRRLAELDESLRDSESQLRNLKEECASLELQRESSHSQLEEQRAVVDQILMEKTEAEASFRQCQEQLERTVQELNRYRSLLSELQFDVCNLREEVTVAKEQEESHLLQRMDEFASVQKGITEGKDALSQLHREIEELRIEYCSMVDNVELIKREKFQWSEELQLEIERKREDFGLLIQQVSAHHAQIASLDALLESKEALVKAAKDELETLRGEEAGLLQRIRCASDWLAELKEGCEDCALALLAGNNEWSVLLQNAHDEHTKIEHLQEEFASQSQRLSALNEKVESSEVELFHLATAIASMKILEEENQAEFESSTRKIETARAELLSLETSKRELNEQWITANQWIDERNLVLHSVNQEISQLSEDCSKLAAMKISMESLLDALISNSVVLEERNQKLSADCFNNALQLDKLLDDIEAMNQKERELIDRIVEKSAELAQCETSLDRLQVQCCDAKEELAATTASLEKTQDALMALERSSENSIERLAVVDRKVIDSTEEWNQLQSEIKGLISRREQLEEELASGRRSVNELLHEREEQYLVLKTTNDEIENKRIELQELESSVNEMALSRNLLNQELGELRERERSVQSELLELEKRRDEHNLLVAKVVDAREELLVVEGRVEQCESHLSKLQQQARGAESQLEEMRSQERDCEHRLEERRIELQRVQLLIATKEAEFQAVQETLAKVLTELAPQESKLALAQKELASLSQKRDSQLKELDTLAKEAKDANEICEKWRQYQSSLEKEIQSLTKDRDSKGREIVELESRKGESLQLLETLQRERQQIEATQQQLRAQTEKIREECLRQEQLVEGWVAKRSELSAECKSLQLGAEEHAKLRDRIEAEVDLLRHHTNAWSAKLETLQRDYANLEMAIARESDNLAIKVSDSELLDRKIRTKQEDLAILNEQSASLQIELDQKEAWLREWKQGEAERRSAKESHEALVMELADLREQLEELTIEISEKSSGKQKLGEELSGLTNSVSEETQRLDRLSAEQQEIRDRIRQLSQQEVALKAQVDSQSAAHSQLEERMRHMEWETGQRQLELAHEEVRLRELQALVHAIEAKKTQLSEELAILGEERMSLMEAIPTSRKALQELRDQMLSESSERKEIEAQCVAVQSQLLVAERNWEAKQAELSQQQAAIEDKRDLLRSLAATEQLLNLRIDSLRDEEVCLGKTIADKSATLAALEASVFEPLNRGRGDVQSPTTIDIESLSTERPADFEVKVSDTLVDWKGASERVSQSSDSLLIDEFDASGSKESVRDETRIAEEILMELQDLQSDRQTPERLEGEMNDSRAVAIDRQPSPWDVVLG